MSNIRTWEEGEDPEHVQAKVNFQVIEPPRRSLELLEMQHDGFRDAYRVTPETDVTGALKRVPDGSPVWQYIEKKNVNGVLIPSKDPEHHFRLYPPEERIMKSELFDMELHPQAQEITVNGLTYTPEDKRLSTGDTQRFATSVKALIRRRYSPA